MWYILYIRYIIGYKQGYIILLSIWTSIRSNIYLLIDMGAPKLL